MTNRTLALLATIQLVVITGGGYYLKGIFG